MQLCVMIRAEAGTASVVVVALCFMGQGSEESRGPDGTNGGNMVEEERRSATRTREVSVHSGLHSRPGPIGERQRRRGTEVAWTEAGEEGGGCRRGVMNRRH